MASRLFSWRERGTVRVRITLAAVTVVGVTFAISALAMVVLLHRTLTGDVREAATIRGEGIAEVMRTDDDEAVLNGHPEEEFVQVLAADGRVVDSSDNLNGEPAVAALTGGEAREIDDVPIGKGEFLAVGVGTTFRGVPVTVVVGRTIEPVDHAVHDVIVLLVFGILLLLIVVGFVAWWMVGRALAPVEAIRSEVELITAQELHRRVPDPPGSDEISRLAATMNGMLARLERERARERRFVSDASHELRSPIASIRQHAEVAVAHPETSHLGELAETVLEELAVLQRLVEDLMLLTRIDEGTLRLRPEPVDLDDLVLREGARLRGSRPDLAVDLAGVRAARTRGDAIALDRLVRNLTENASRHARHAMALGLREHDGHVVLTVDDDGSGIAPEERGRVFDRFVRLDEARDRDSGGTGLGLAIVREVAAAHGATVDISDAPLGGARFEVRFRAETEEEISDQDLYTDYRLH
jgi:signal transduction histidine kinase